MTGKYLVERKLLYSLKNSSEKTEFIIRIGAPVRKNEGYICPAKWDGLFEVPMDKYGIDPIHALYLATDVEPFLMRLSKKYDFYWPDGEPYFDEEDKQI